MRAYKHRMSSSFLERVNYSQKLIYSYIYMNCTAAGIYAPDMRKLYRELELPNKPRLNYLFGQLNKKERVAIKTPTGKWYLIHFLEDQYSTKMNLNNRLYLGIEKELIRNQISPMFLPIEFKHIGKKRRKTKVPEWGGVRASNSKLLETPEFIDYLEGRYPNQDVKGLIMDLIRWREAHKGTGKVNKKRYDTFVIKKLNYKEKNGPTSDFKVDSASIDW